MAKPEYAIREVSLAEVILFLLSAIILAAYHFDYRVATYIIFLDFFQSFKIIVALRQLMETKRHQKMFGSLPDAYYYDSLLMRKYNWIWTNILISLLAIAAAPCLFSAGFQTMVKRFLRLLFFFLERLDHMDLERVLYKKMTKDELIDKLIAYKNIECHDRAIAHEFLCMQKEDPSRMNFVTHRLTDIADPKRVAEEIRRVKAERTASAQQPIKDELTDTIPVYVTLYKNIRFKKRFDVTLDQLERLKEEDSAESKEVPITLLDETLNLMDATLDALNATNEADLDYELEYSFSYGDPEQPLDGSETEEEVPVAEADDSDVNSEMESVLFDWH